LLENFTAKYYRFRNFSFLRCFFIPSVLWRYWLGNRRASGL